MRARQQDDRLVETQRPRAVPGRNRPHSADREEQHAHVWAEVLGVSESISSKACRSEPCDPECEQEPRSRENSGKRTWFRHCECRNEQERGQDLGQYSHAAGDGNLVPLIAEIEESLRESGKKFLAQARQLSKSRAEAAGRFARMIETELAELAMARTRFEVRLTTNEA